MTYREFIKKLREEIVRLPNSLGIDRKDMPQIRSFNVMDYLEWLHNEHNVTFRIEEIDADKLKPIQSAIDSDRVKAMVPGQSKDKPMVVSKDNYILDGHHRWFQAKEAGEKIRVYHLSIGMRKLLDITKAYSKVEYHQLKAN